MNNTTTVPTPAHLRFLFSFAVRIERPDRPQYLPLAIGRYWRSADRRAELVPPDRIMSGEFHPAAVSVETAAAIVRVDLAEYGRTFGATGAVVLSVLASHSSPAGTAGPESGAAIHLAKLLGVN